MQLISFSFYLAWAVMLILYYLMRKGRWVVLLMGSLVLFCLMAEGLPLIILGSSLVAWLYGRLAEKGEASGRMGIFAASFLQIGILVLFRHVLEGQYQGNTVLTRAFPLLGISFYLMSALSYMIDVYRKTILPEKNYGKLLLELCFFPSLLQGPIHRYGDFSKQVFADHPFSLERLISGVLRFLFGLLKKLVLVPRLAVFTEMVFSDHQAVSPAALILGTICFLTQLYADWSGYMDLVLGIAETFGIEMPENFRRPFFATSVSDVWKRWHITLSRWFRDYVYIPLGGSRRGMGRAALAVFSVWILTALWHGTEGGYLLWGLYFGILSLLGVFFRKYGKIDAAVPHSPEHPFLHGIRRVFRSLLIFLLTAAGFFFFASGSMENIRILLEGAAQGGFGLDSLAGELAQQYNGFDIGILLISGFAWFLISLRQERGRKIREDLEMLPLPLRWLLYLALIFTVILFGRYGQQYDAGAFMYQGF